MAEQFALWVAHLFQLLLGPRADAVLYARIRWADILAALTILLVVVVVNRFAAVLLLRHQRRAEAEPENKRWPARVFNAVRRPLYLLIWVVGLYFALMPIVMHLGAADGVHPARRLVGRLFDLGVFVAVLWLVFRLTRVLENRLTVLTSRSETKLDDELVPLIGRSLRMVVPVLGIILALPLLNLPASYHGVVSKGSSVLIIVAVVWILFQAVCVAQKIILSRYDLKQRDNFEARKVYTQVQVLGKTLHVCIAIFAIASVLMLFEELRRLGTSILASAGVIGIIVGFAAQRTIANLFAGFQLALTQPIRIDDAVVVEGEFGNIEEITLTYVVVKLWDERRLIVPLSTFIEKPFQNWTRSSTSVIGAVTLYVDYSLPLEQVRQAAKGFVESSPAWDRRFWNLQVTDATDRAMQIRVLATAVDAGRAWDLRCEIREKLIHFLQQVHPRSLPRVRMETDAQMRLPSPRDESARAPAETARTG